MANDSSPGVTPSAFSTLRAGSSPRLTIDQTVVQVTGGQVTLTLTPRSPLPDRATLSIKSPLFGWLGQSEPYPDRHFPELKFSSNAVPLGASDSFQALVGTSDVSAMLREAGVNPWLIAETPPFVSTDDIKPETLARLLRAGALLASGDDYLAQWRAQRTLSVPLRLGQPITLTYRLRPGYAMLTKRALSQPDLRKRYCLWGEPLRNALQESDNKTLFAVRQYAIPVNVDRRSPQSVRLSVAPQAGVAWLATCARTGAGAASGADGLTDIAVKPDQHGQLNILAIELH